MTSDVMTECGMCGEGVDDPRLLSECLSCGQAFHLNPYNSGEHRDCGDAIIGPTQGVEFWCGSCIERLEAELSANPVDPRAALDQLAAPGGLLLRAPAAEPTEPTSAPAAAPPTPATAKTTERDAPPRRARPERGRRYRRIDR